MPTPPTNARAEMLRTMERIRAFERRVGDLFADGEIPGFVHLYIGEEAIAAGVCQALADEDYVTSTHRGHGHCIAKGHELGPMMAELFGKETGYCKGKGGSMHIADPDLGNLGANGIVGAGYPIGVGAALSSQLRGAGEVAVSFAGDGSLAQGAFHESMNLAALWDLPFVAVVENNKFGEYSGLEEQQSVSDLTRRAEGYGVPSAAVDGMDPDAVYEAAVEAVDRARAGEGPTLLVCEAYRFRGHHEGDSGFYRDDEEVESWRERDPLPAYRERLREAGALDEDDLAAMREDAESAVEEAVGFARESPYPDPEAAYDDLYAEEAGR
ncbi:MAG: thiamine pyrophosphate-dependent dehydrogenase E1 component subunit alpha [Halobacteriaceae archaeon]